MALVYYIFTIVCAKARLKNLLVEPLVDILSKVALRVRIWQHKLSFVCRQLKNGSNDMSYWKDKSKQNHWASTIFQLLW